MPFGVSMAVAYAPQGDRLAVGLAGASGGLDNYELWIYDIARETPTLLTTNATTPLWSQDGDRILYFSREVGQEGIYRRRSDGTDEPELLYRPPGASGITGSVALPQGWSRDGASLVFVEGDGTRGFDINLLSMDDHRVTPLIATEFSDHSASMSPDGRWIAYVSNRSGIEEVFIQTFPGLAGRVQVSNGGAAQPVWGPTGDVLFYQTFNSELRAVPIDTSTTSVVGDSKLFSSGTFGRAVDSFSQRTFDTSPDGTHLVSVARGSVGLEGLTGLVLVENWFEELKRVVPLD